MELVDFSGGTSKELFIIRVEDINGVYHRIHKKIGRGKGYDEMRIFEYKLR